MNTNCKQIILEGLHMYEECDQECFEDTQLRCSEEEQEQYDHQQYILEEEKFWGYKYR